MLPFAAASLTPVLLLGIGLLAGGAWLGAALLWVTVLAVLLDQMPAFVQADVPDGAEFPAGEGLLVLLGLSQLVLMPLAVWAVARAGSLDSLEQVLAFLAAGLVAGQIGMPVAHELIHRADRRLYVLGVAILVAFLFGHHASAHRLVHHRHVGTGKDPNSARRGESLYAFLPRAWTGSFRAGLAAESARRRHGLHPYAVYTGGSLVCLAVAFALGGVAGLAIWTGLGLWATAQLLASDYVQHYGLYRAPGADGRHGPVGHDQSWNAPHWFSAALTVNAPRHSDHHAHPGRPYPALRLPDDAPMLPWPLPVMVVVALFPKLWRRVMHPRLEAVPSRSRERDVAGLGRAGVDLAS